MKVWSRFRLLETDSRGWHSQYGTLRFHKRCTFLDNTYTCKLFDNDPAPCRWRF